MVLSPPPDLQSPAGSARGPRRRPGLARRTWSYAQAVARWIAAGRPTRSAREVDYLLAAHCRHCQAYDPQQQLCAACGCRISRRLVPLANKLAMATEACPLAKFHASPGEKLSMDALHDFFERVYLINLRRRPDRLRTCLARLERYGWPFKMPQVYAAVDGDKVGVPPEFTQGGGAYGCRMSHLRILQDCLLEDVASVLILEDDADITEGFPERVRAFLERVPSDWEGIMLGGQHHAPPIATGIPGVVRVRYCQRTHAYAARREYMRALQRRWGNATVHIDWLMRDWQHQHIVYAPESWLIGQAGGRSDIRGAEKPMEWWNSQTLPPGPVAVAMVTRDVLETMLPLGFHPGMERDADGIDVTLKRCLADGTALQHRIEGLRRWLGWIQAESVGGLLPTVWHPAATVELVRQAWAGPVYEVRGSSAEEAFGCLPAEVQERMRQRASVRINPIVLLSCPRDMVEQLHAHGFHPGYWRDRQTGIDRGLERIFGEVPRERQIEELRKWCEFLCREGDRDGLMVVARHHQLTAAMLKAATTRPVLEIKANSIEELKRAVVGAS